VNAFVDECRREWKRLRVPHQLTEEMAAELEADLIEAGSAEELLGPAATDASSFARDWAIERGVVRRRRHPVIPTVLATLALVSTIAGAGLLLHESDSDSSPPERTAVVVPGPRAGLAPSQRTAVVALANLAAQQNALLRARLVALDKSEGEGGDHKALGLGLLIVGLAALVAVTLLRLRRAALNR
jgi:hypothetical protein